MALTPGTRLGPYEILAALGAGGMGEVYRARDSRLDRMVAIKVLSTGTSSSPDARQRFEREARTISQLSHPHICKLYDVGEIQASGSAQPLQYFVMELLEGETLAQRLASGPLPLELTLRYASQIADALDKAHRAGIVHRDLKPANVMVTRTGATLLDFGLAREHPPVHAPAGHSVAATALSPGVITEEGSFLGTLQYMAPEQLEGGRADARSDLFAFGTVLFEMATGRKAFDGVSRVAIASAVLREQPPVASSVNPVIPSALDVLIDTCLAKDPDNRWQHARDVTLQLISLQAAAADARRSGAAPRVQSRRAVAVWAPWLVAAAAMTAALALGLRPRLPPALGAVSFPISPPSGTKFPDTVETVPFALSPDGSSLAIVAHAKDGSSRLWLRTMSADVPRPIAGTEGADGVFWSPDGRSLGFFAGTKLKRVDIVGGAVVPLCDVREGIGKSGTWGRDGQVLFSSVEGDAIYRTSTAGEKAVVVVKPSRSDSGARVTWPVFLPDGRRFLYLERTSRGAGELMIGEADQTPRKVMPLDSNVQYVEAGYLVFAREGILLGQKFDLASARAVGEPFSIANPVRYFFPTGLAQFSTSLSGALAYLTHGYAARAARVDRTGRIVGAVGTSSENGRLHVSWDGQTALFDRPQAGSGTMDVWSIDLARDVEVRLTTDPGTEAGGIMIPGTHAVIFSSTNRGGPPNLVRKNLETGAEEYLLPFSPVLQMPEDISADGRILVYSQRGQGGQFDLWTLPLGGNGTPAGYLVSSADEVSARIAPDGRFVAYLSNDSGRYEVEVASFPSRGAPTRVSSGGARMPRWSRDGRELFFIASDGQLMAVPMRTTPTLQVGRPVSLFNLGDPQRWVGFDVLPDGRFLAMIAESEAGEQALTVVLNWAAGVRP